MTRGAIGLPFFSILWSSGDGGSLVIIGHLLLTSWICVSLFIGPHRRSLDEIKSTAKAFLRIMSFNTLYIYIVVSISGFAMGAHIRIATHGRVHIDGREGDFPELAA